MRLLIGIVALVPIAAACSSDEGAVFVLHGGSTATKVEIVLASPAVSVKVQQRHSGDKAEVEDVRYYKQLSTSGLITDLGSIDGATVRLEPNPNAEMFVPLVFAYSVDANGTDTLVAAGRIHHDDAEQTPVEIEIPAGRLDRYEVDLEPIEHPDQTGIVANHGAVVRCSDNELRGIAWRFTHGIQLRLILPVAGELSAIDRELDLDCDQHDVEAGADCDDLSIAYNPAMVETGCSSPDYNCDGQVVTEQACSFPSGCEGVARCDDPALCIPMDTLACRCDANVCIQGGCRLEKVVGGNPGTIHLCQPAIAEVHQKCPEDASQCDVKVRSGPSPDWVIEVGKPVDLSGTPVFSDTVTLGPLETLLIRATHAATPDMAPPAVSSFGEIDLEIKISPAAGGPDLTERVLINFFLSAGQPTNTTCAPYTAGGAMQPAPSMMDCSF